MRASGSVGIGLTSESNISKLSNALKMNLLAIYTYNGKVVVV